MTQPVIEARKISVSFGAVAALSEVDISVERGTVHGLLGHNGAGKTTLVNVLSTLVLPTSGEATVAGFDVRDQGHLVRGRIGLTGQFASVDDNLCGRDNLVLVARLLGASARQARSRADDLLAVFGLTDAAQRAVKTYSGGMRRRIDLAASLVGRPEVLFLDEPTTGLDPPGRLGLWQIIEELVTSGTTALLTTQYLTEADRLAQRISVLSRGRVAVSGTPAALKARVGGASTHLRLAVQADTDRAVALLAEAGFTPLPGVGDESVVLPATTPSDLATAIVALEREQIAIAEVTMAEPTLDDVYLAVTDSPHD
ncbi:ATP-binding cassette domain-containing protein [Saccharothrix xinjiangensis]|uniref:ATP-binding cassette domain-containing protein n=1 Tax=Saccharothrix xinjiangensis TaxID=204798 RepID=A0ABV9XXM6_9PSEU